jgi:hypothetical protein
MKIKISKSQWELIGDKAGWIKEAQMMSRYETLDLGPTPAGEDCAQVGSNNYDQLTRIETRAYIGQLQRMFPNIPLGCRFVVTNNSHDFGTYHEVAIKFSEDDEEATNFAYGIESKIPELWDEIARNELQKLGYFDQLVKK